MTTEINAREMRKLSDDFKRQNDAEHMDKEIATITAAIHGRAKQGWNIFIYDVNHSIANIVTQELRRRGFNVGVRYFGRKDRLTISW